MGTVCRLKEAKGVPGGVGLVWNISTGGVSLLTSTPIQPGTHVDGDLTTLASDSKLHVMFSVTHLSKLQTGDYCVGGRFDHLLADDEMKPFVA
jgi:hypothetical protein